MDSVAFWVFLMGPSQSDDDHRRDRWRLWRRRRLEDPGIQPAARPAGRNGPGACGSPRAAPAPWLGRNAVASLGITAAYTPTGDLPGNERGHFEISGRCALSRSTAAANWVSSSAYGFVIFSSGLVFDRYSAASAM